MIIDFNILKTLKENCLLIMSIIEMRKFRLRKLNKLSDVIYLRGQEAEFDALSVSTPVFVDYNIISFISY